MAWGKAKYGSTFKQARNIKEDETVVFRILPPMKSLLDKGQWHMYHKQHFGYNTKVKNDPSKVNYYTFACPEKIDFRTKAVIIECVECSRIKRQKDLLDDARKKQKALGKSDEEISQHVKPISSWLTKHNLDFKCYINVKYDKEFNGSLYGTLRLGHKAKKALDLLIKDLINPKVKGVKPIDPIDPEQGVWFEITRTGKKLQTDYSLKVVKQAVEFQGRQLEETKLAPLSESEAEKAEEACFDLADVGIRVLPIDKIVQLVKAKTDEEIDAIFDAPKQSNKTLSETVEVPEDSPEVHEPPVTAVAETAPVVSAAPQETPPPEVTDPMEMTQEEFDRIYGKQA